MDSLTELVNPQSVLVVGAIAISFLLIMLFFRILKAGFRLILVILAIVLGLQYLFGISPGQLWGEISHLPQDAIRLVQGIDLNAFTSMLAD